MVVMTEAEVTKPMEESRLIERAMDGDAASFNTLMEAHERRMYAVALRMCGNHEDAQDCLQEAMLRIYRAISGFKAQSSFATWVYRITMNACLDELRKRKSRPNISLDGLLDTGWSPVDGGESPEGHAMRREMRRTLQRFIGELPEDMRAAVVLRDIEGYSYEEIAGILDANVGTIKSRISRGRERLREKIGGRPELFDRHDV